MPTASSATPTVPANTETTLTFPLMGASLPGRETFVKPSVA
jgi:hypothetical protein